MIRFMNLGATLALNITDYERGMQRAAALSAKAEKDFQKLSTAAEESERRLAEVGKKRADAAEKINEQIEKAELEHQARILEIEVKAEKERQEKINRVETLLANLKSAEEIERRYAARMSEAERQLSKERLAEIKKNSDERLRLANKERAALLKLKKDSNQELSALDKQREQALLKERAGLSGKLSSERARAKTLLSEIEQLPGRLSQVKDPKEYARLTERQLAILKEYSQSLQTQGSTKREIGNVDAKIKSLGMENDVQARIDLLNKEIGQTTEVLVKKHIETWQNKTAALKNAIEINKQKYLEKNEAKVKVLEETLAKLNDNSDGADEIRKQILTIEKRKDAYIERKRKELERIDNQLKIAEERRNAAVDRMNSAGGPDLQATREAASRTYVNRAMNLDAIGGKLLMGGGVAGAGLAAAVKSGSEISRTYLRELHSTSLQTQEEIDKMFSVVQDAALTTGKRFDDLLTAYRQIENIVGKENVVTVFNASLKGAVATGTDLMQMAETTSKAITAFGGKAKDASRYVNALAYAAQISQLDMSQLAKIAGESFGLAQAAGISFTDATAALTLFSKANLDSSQAATQFRNGLNKLMQPAKDTQKVLWEIYDQTKVNLPEAFTRASLKTKGLAFAFGEVRQAAKLMGKDAEDLAFQLFPNLRGTLAGLILTSEQGYTQFAEISKGMGKVFRDNSDFLDTRYNRVLADSSTQLDIVARSTESLALSVSKILTPEVTKLARGLSDLVTKFTALSPQVKENIKQITLWGLGITAVLGVGLKLASVYYSIRAAALGAAAAQQLLEGSSVGVASKISSLVGGLSLARLGWIGLGAAVLGGVVYAYNKYLDNAEEVRNSVQKEKEYQDQLTKSLINSNSQRFDQVTKAKELVKSLQELEKTTKNVKEKEEARQTILKEISDLFPNLITGYTQQGKAIGIVAGAMERLNKEQAKSNNLVFESEKIRRQRSVEEVRNNPELAILQKKKDFLTSINKGQITPGQISEGRALFDLPFVKMGNKADADRVTASQLVDKKNREFSVIEKKIADYRQKILNMEKDNKEWEVRARKALQQGTKVDSAATGVPPVSGENLEDLITKLQNFGGGGNQGLSIDDSIQKKEAKIQRIKGEVQRVFGIYRNLREQLYYLTNGETEKAKAEFEKIMQSDQFFVRLMEDSPVGKDLTNIAGAWGSILDDLTKELLGVSRDLDKAKQTRERLNLKERIQKEVSDMLEDLNARIATKEGEKEKTYYEKANAFLRSEAVAGTGISKESALGNMNIMAGTLRDLAKKADKFESDTKLDEQKRQLGNVLENFFQKKKEGEQVFNAIMDVFEKSPQLLKAYGGIDGAKLFAGWTQAFWKMNKQAEEGASILDRLKKALLDAKNPFSDLDRIAADFSGGEFTRYQDFLNSFGDTTLRKDIEAITKELAKTRKESENVDTTFDNLSSRIEKVRGKIGLLTSASADYNDWFSKTFGDKTAPDNKKDDLQRLFLLETFADRMVGVRDKLMSLRKKAGLNDVLYQDGTGLLAGVDADIKKLEKYEARLRTFEANFKSVFTSAFEGGLQKSGNFFKAFGEGMKSLVIRQGTEQLANGVFDFLKGSLEKQFPGLRKPSLSKDSIDIISNPSGFLSEWERRFFKNPNNVMNVRVIDGKIPGVFNPTETLPRQDSPYPSLPPSESKKDPGSSSRSMSPWAYGKYAAQGYVLSKSKAGQEVTGLGTAITGLSKMKGFGSLAGVGGFVTSVGLGLAVNDLLGNPIGKLRKRIFGRSTRGTMLPGNGYVVGEDGPELVVPVSAGQVRSVPAESQGPLQINGNLVVQNINQAHEIAREFTRIQRVSQLTSGTLQRRRA